jgi:DNA repair protein RecO (recombination protein O)
MGIEKRQRRLAAVVLGKSNYGEADLIVTFLTREMGLVSALARYGRRSVRRFGGGLLSPGVAAWYDFTFKPNIDLAFVEKGEENPRAMRLPASPLIQSLAAFALELVRGFEAPGNPAEESFKLLVRHLSRLARAGEGGAARLISLDFALKYMELAGFGPRLEGCLLCGSAPGPEPGWRWDPVAGGLYCPACAPETGGRIRPIPANILRRLSPGETPSPPLSPDDLSEAELFFEKLAESHLERPLKSIKALRRLLKESVL